MNMLQRSAVIVLTAMILWLGWRSRPARLAAARVTAVSPGNPAIAHVAVSYASGTLPVSTIIELGNARARGSMTLDGLTRFVDIPLYGNPEPVFVVHTTAIYRWFGRTIVIQQSFR